MVCERDQEPILQTDLTVNGQKIELNNFVQSFMGGAIIGMLASLRAPHLILRMHTKETCFCIMALCMKLWQLWPTAQWCCVPVCEHGPGDGECMIGEAKSEQVLILLSRLGDYSIMILPDRAS